VPAEVGAPLAAAADAIAGDVRALAK